MILKKKEKEKINIKEIKKSFNEKIVIENINQSVIFNSNRYLETQREIAQKIKDEEEIKKKLQKKKKRLKIC